MRENAAHEWGTWQGTRDKGKEGQKGKRQKVDPFLRLKNDYGQG
jgi:hypothetical protein